MQKLEFLCLGCASLTVSVHSTSLSGMCGAEVIRCDASPDVDDHDQKGSYWLAAQQHGDPLPILRPLKWRS